MPQEHANIEFAEQLGVHLRAQFPLLLVDTVEEQRLVDKVAAATEPLSMRCLTWDSVSGFSSVHDSRSMAPATDPLDVLERLRGMSSNSVVVLKDFHTQWENPQVLRATRNYAQRRGEAGPTVIVVGAGATPPPELADSAVILEFPPPSRVELQAVLREVLEGRWVRRELDDGGMDRLIESGRGLTLEQARRVFTKAVVADGVLDHGDIRLVLEEKKAIIATSGALEYLEPDEAAEDVGGLDALKEWLRLRERGFSSSAREFGLPAPKGIALGRAVTPP